MYRQGQKYKEYSIIIPSHIFKIVNLRLFRLALSFTALCSVHSQRKGADFLLFKIVNLRLFRLALSFTALRSVHSQRKGADFLL
ncbi:MAG: hypothetical protein IJ666_06825 [Ruminococcus sp.]|nr:hypothetical protein [Ruminococcus sp.]